MKTQSAKAKGRRLQQHVVKRILHYFPTLTEKDARSTSMGVTGVDIQFSEIAWEALQKTAWECKNRKAIAIYKDYEQAQSHCEVDTAEPVVVLKQDRSEPLACVALDHYIELLAYKYYNKKEQHNDKKSQSHS